MEENESASLQSKITLWWEKLTHRLGWLQPHVSVVAEEIGRLFLALCAVSFLNYMLIYGVRAIWLVYIETYVGKHFVEHASVWAERMQFIVNLDSPIAAGFEIAWLTILAVVVIAVVSQLFLLRQLFYVPAGIFKPAWGIVLTICFAMYGKEFLYLPETKLAFMLFLPSALCLMPTAMKIAGNLVPDIVSLAVALKNRVEERFF